MKDLEYLETIIDRHGLAWVLDMLSQICDEKAEHLAHNWQDTNAAKFWTRRAAAIHKAAAIAETLGG